MSGPVLLMAVTVVTLAGCSDLARLDRQEPTNYDPHVTVIDIGEGGNTEALAFSPDGRLLAAASDAIRLWDLEAGRTVRTLDSGVLVILVVAFIPDGIIIVI
jgi:WD40 repeat protein